MSRRFTGLALAVSVLAFPGVAVADDLRGESSFLCTAVNVTRCADDGDCTNVVPWKLNIPQFIVVNLTEKTLSTTKASGENRSTPIKNFLKEGGQMFLQGVEGGRAFSFVITEETGRAAITVASEGRTVSIFGACTPTAATK